MIYYLGETLLPPAGTLDFSWRRKTSAIHPIPCLEAYLGGMHPLSYPDALRNESKAALEVAAGVLTFKIILKAQCPPLPPASTVSPENKAEQPHD